MASKNQLIKNPVTGDYSFGTFREIRSGEILIPEGEIFLRYGEHRGVNNGFGQKHIWVEHAEGGKGLIAKGYETEEDVARYVVDILQSGASIHSEFGRTWHRVQVG